MVKRERERGSEGVRKGDGETETETVFINWLPFNWQEVFPTEEGNLKSKEQIDENIFRTPI